MNCTLSAWSVSTYFVIIRNSAQFQHFSIYCKLPVGIFEFFSIFVDEPEAGSIPLISWDIFFNHDLNPRVFCFNNNYFWKRENLFIVRIRVHIILKFMTWIHIYPKGLDPGTPFSIGCYSQQLLNSTYVHRYTEWVRSYCWLTLYANVTNNKTYSSETIFKILWWCVKN